MKRDHDELLDHDALEAVRWRNAARIFPPGTLESRP